ncbi:2455_t:CDS:2 [Dentiscutata erythropus]|uniref:2455_t:CDS:1 n=1 Tax=Dentiscutata erythropus TaxID=1348616 RepID=A0A9N9IH62_9GLOM|nr:2455_t:CDS:2 [Dentiscutata erythropus]
MSGEFGFPQNEWFYIKSQINGHVLEPQSLSVNSGVRIIISKQRFGFDADSQLWKCDNGFIINRASGKVLDIQGAQNQRWAYLPEGFICPLNNNEYVLHVSGHFGIEKLEGADVLLHHVKDHESHKQKWTFEKERDQPAIMAPPIPRDLTPTMLKKDIFANDIINQSSESSYT